MPDWIIEIVSPSSRSMDYHTKVSLYHSAGVREYWIVDPMKEIVLVYDMEHASSPSIYYEDLYIDLSDIGTVQEGR